MASLESPSDIVVPRSGRLTRKMKSAFTGRIITLSYENTNDECLLPEIFLYETLEPLRIEVNSFLKANQAFKFNIELHAIYTKPNVNHFENNQLETNVFRTDMKDVYWLEDFENEFLNQVKFIIRKSEKFQLKQSGWALLQLIKVDYNLVKYQPLKGSGYIPLPKKLEKIGACINVQNKDEFCFKWAVLASLSSFIKKHRPSTYKVNISSEIIEFNGHILNFKGLNFPLEVENVSIFEDNNPGISINVLGYDKQNHLVIGPYYKARSKRTKHINLLFFEEMIEQNTIGHYVWIKNLSRLVRSQVTLHQKKVTICDTCLQHFHGDNIEKHYKNCGQEEEIVIEQDKCGLEFKNYVKTIDVPFAAYVNYECISDSANNPTSYIFTYFIKCSYDNDLNKWRSFKGLDAPKLFAKNLIDDAKHFYINYSKKTTPKIPLTDEESAKYHHDSSCCICSRKILAEKVKLHCRLSGRYRGPAHHACALNHRIPKKFPVLLRNLTHNNSKLLIKLFSDIDEDPINVRPFSESNVSFTKDISVVTGGKLELRFLNVYAFMPFSLDYLIQHTPKEDFKTLKLTYPDNENKISLLLRKLIFPHNYINSVEKLTETALPSIDYFNNTLINKECSPDDYAHAKSVWDEFQCKTLDDYLMLCLKTDVILLTDIFEKYRSICKNAYNLDPCNYYSSAEFSWDAMFKITDIKLKLLTDASMISFIKKGVREAISKCFQTRSVANNKYLSDYNDKLPSKYLMYFHANDFYGKIMSESLPDGNFEWESDIENFYLDSIPNDSKTGYILEVDLEYPKEVHDTHTIFPFCIQNRTSPDKDSDIDLKNYVIYYKNLQQCLKHGLKLKRIHRILKFSQSDWLKKYITLNKTLKANGKNSFEVNVFEVMNDELYKKIMEKSGKIIKILHRWESDGRRLGARAFIIRPQFSSASIIDDENIVALQFNVNICQYMPIYLEFVISELARLKIYSFHYEYMIPKYESKFQLNYIDRDSLIYTITTNDLYQDITNEICLMIHNELIGNAVNNNDLSLKMLGMMKDATDGGVIKEFIGLRPKLYSLKTEALRETNDVNACNYTSLSDYKNLFCNKQIYCDDINSFKLKLFQRYTKLFNELSISYLDDNACNEINEGEAMDFE